MCILKKYENANFRIMTSNLLFDSTAPDRIDKIIDNFAYYRPELIGLQEVNKFYNDNLPKKLSKLGYKLTSAWPDPNNKRESELASLAKKYPSVNYHPIAYLSERLEEIKSCYMLYTSAWTYTKGFTSAVFRDKSTGRLLAHINTHAALLLASYNLDGEKDSILGAKWRIDNARQLLEERDAIHAEFGDIPVFFTGDFNGGENEQYYADIISGGMLNAKYTATVSASLGQFTFHPVIGKLPDDKRSPIDHIFVSPNVPVWVHSIERRQEVLDASDHCMVYADISI